MEETLPKSQREIQPDIEYDNLKKCLYSKLFKVFIDFSLLLLITFLVRV